MPLQDDFNDAADEWFALEDGSFPAVPRPAASALIAVRATVELPVLDTAGFRARPDAVKAALVILSQSPTARKFAQAAIRAGYSIAVDPPSLSGAGAEYEDDSFGNTDHAGRRINVRGTDDPLKLAMVLAHELAHVSQIVDGGLDIHVSAQHPLSSIRQLLAMEGDARAYEFLIASELQFPAKDDPEERLLFPCMLDVAAESIGVGLAKKVVELAKPGLEKGADPSEYMARVFKSFYASPSLREHYENTILHSIATLEREQPGSLSDPALFQGRVPAEEIMSRLDGHGVPYLSKHAGKYIDLDDPLMCSVSARTQQKLVALEALRHRNPAVPDGEHWEGTVYHPVSARPKQGPAP